MTKLPSGTRQNNTLNYLNRVQVVGGSNIRNYALVNKEKQ